MHKISQEGFASLLRKPSPATLVETDKSLLYKESKSLGFSIPDILTHLEHFCVDSSICSSVVPQMKANVEDLVEPNYPSLQLLEINVRVNPMFVVSPAENWALWEKECMALFLL